MLFSSYVFLFCFLPLLILVLRLPLFAIGQRLPLVLILFSLFFYGWDNSVFLMLLLFVVCVNYIFGILFVNNNIHTEYFGQTLEKQPYNSDKESRSLLAKINKFIHLSRKRLFILALVFNLLPLAWYKYSVFFAENITYLLGINNGFSSPSLPLGISFYTFIQIAWIVGVYNGKIAPAGLPRHILFSTFFPWVISGPIVRYEQIGPQLDRIAPSDSDSMAKGIALFAIGLAKKVIIADSIGFYANGVFNAAENGFPLTGAEAWLGSLCYTFQLYFDFSGYTDMATGIGLMLGLSLPTNFNAPYRATGIVDFWRRWHITLGSWLRDFLYIPLGGNRGGRLKQYRNLFLTMLIGGIWHGAGWTFVIWGALHGLMLGTNHFFRAQIMGKSCEVFFAKIPCRFLFIIVTFMCVNFSWVVFRAGSVEGACQMYLAMANVFLEPSVQWRLLNNYFNDWLPFALLLFSGIVVWFFPTSQAMINGYGDGTRPRFHWTPSRKWAIWLAVLVTVALVLASRKATFLYFQF